MMQLLQERQRRRPLKAFFWFSAIDTEGHCNTLTDFHSTIGNTINVRNIFLLHVTKSFTTSGGTEIVVLTE
jgi:hypothetical protein